jgi:hypothetical protein
MLHSASAVVDDMSITPTKPTPSAAKVPRHAAIKGHFIVMPKCDSGPQHPWIVNVVVAAEHVSDFLAHRDVHRADVIRMFEMPIAWMSEWRFGEYQPEVVSSEIAFEHDTIIIVV